MDDFLTKIMAIGSDVKEVEEKANEKAKETKPSSRMVGTTSHEQVAQNKPKA